MEIDDHEGQFRRIELWAAREATRLVMKHAGKLLQTLSDDALQFTELTFEDVNTFTSALRESADMLDGIAQKAME